MNRLGGRHLEQRVQNLTKGNIYKTLAVSALPYLMANFIQALYGAVDMMVVGWFNDAAVVAAVSIGTQMMQIVISFVAGLTMGGTIIIAPVSYTHLWLSVLSRFMLYRIPMVAAKTAITEIREK